MCVSSILKTRFCRNDEPLLFGRRTFDGFGRDDVCSRSLTFVG